MNWGSWEKFLAMGGYAFYVWGSYLVTLGLILAEVVLLGVRKRATLGRLRARGTLGQGEL
jgi:heme exporter protein D